jgi:hypothetical protein
VLWPRPVLWKPETSLRSPEPSPPEVRRTRIRELESVFPLRRYGTLSGGKKGVAEPLIRLAENGLFSLFYKHFTAFKCLGFPGLNPGPVRRQAA